jgi:hypothetical protein
LKRRALPKVERLIREHGLREWWNPKRDPELAAAAARDAEYQKWRAECQRQADVRAKAEAGAAELHRKLLTDGMADWVSAAKAKAEKKA